MRDAETLPDSTVIVRKVEALELGTQGRHGLRPSWTRGVQGWGKCLWRPSSPDKRKSHTAEEHHPPLGPRTKRVDGKNCCPSPKGGT